MQIRRKKNRGGGGGGGRAAAVLRLAVLVGGGIALLAWLRSSYDEDSSAGVPIAPARRADATANSNGRGGAKGAPKGAGRLQIDLDALPPSSLLHSPDAKAADLPSCPFARHDLSSFAGTFDAAHPAIFTGWHPPAMDKWGNQEDFRSMFGHHAQYVKGKDVQPLKDGEGNACTASTRTLMDVMAEMARENDGKPGKTSEQQSTNRTDLLFFTNDVEHPLFVDAISDDSAPPAPLATLRPFAKQRGVLSAIRAFVAGRHKGFRVFSALERGSSHPFHFHDAAWLGQVHGSRLWYFLPPDTPRDRWGPKGVPKVNGCDYLLGRAALPKGATALVQSPGEVVYFPSKWIHATCALEPWSVGVGGQGGSPNIYEQNFHQLRPMAYVSGSEERKKMVECGVLDKDDIEGKQSSVADGNPLPNATGEKEWKWYDGDLNEYYNKLERDEHAKRDPKKITSYAVHRWMGAKHSTLIHYGLVRQAIYELVLGKYTPLDDTSKASEKLRVFDAGCGLGAGLMWFEEHEPNWHLVGHTISEEQHKWIVDDLPSHNFVANLQTYDEPMGKFNAVYSIEAAIHSPDLKKSLQAWSNALLPGGVIVVIDDFLSMGVPRDDPDVELFAKSWIANSCHSTAEISYWADEMGMTLVRDRDMGSEFQIIKRNYRNKAPELRDEQGRVHQGWLGSKVRQKLMVEGKISYRLVVLQKKGATPKSGAASITRQP